MISCKRIVMLLVVGGSTVLGVPRSFAADEDGRQEAGTEAPAVVPEKWLNYPGKTFSWAHLDGTPILVYRFATWSGPAKDAFPLLKDIGEQFGGRGLTVVGVTDEPPNRLRAFLKKYNLHFAIGAGYKKHYNVRVLPHVWLIRKDRRIAWSGPASELTPTIVEKSLALAASGPKFKLPAALFLAQKALEDGDFVKGLQQLRRYLKDPADEAAGKAARQAVETIEKIALQRLIDARRLAQERSFVSALAAATEIEKEFKGTRAAQKAKEQGREWKRDKRFKLARAAHAQLEKARKAVELKRLDAAIALLKRLVASEKYAETATFEAAKSLLAELEATAE